MMSFLAGETGIILSGLMIILGHIGLANKFLIYTFWLILLAILMYLIQIFTKNDKK